MHTWPRGFRDSEHAASWRAERGFEGESEGVVAPPKGSAGVPLSAKREPPFRRHRDLASQGDEPLRGANGDASKDQYRSTTPTHEKQERSKHGAGARFPRAKGERARWLDCGLKCHSRLSSSFARMLYASGGPCRTAYTPAFGRGYPTTEAQSPAANTPWWEVDSRVGFTRTNPAASVSRPVSAEGCGGGARGRGEGVIERNALAVVDRGSAQERRCAATLKDGESLSPPPGEARLRATAGEQPGCTRPPHPPAPSARRPGGGPWPSPPSPRSPRSSRCSCPSAPERARPGGRTPQASSSQRAVGRESLSRWKNASSSSDEGKRWRAARARRPAPRLEEDAAGAGVVRGQDRTSRHDRDRRVSRGTRCALLQESRRCE